MRWPWQKRPAIAPPLGFDTDRAEGFGTLVFGDTVQGMRLTADDPLAWELFGGVAPELFETAIWWLSFCDADLPEGTQFLGGCYVRAVTDLAAVRRSWELGINPGGSVMMMGPAPEGFLRDDEFDRLLTREEHDVIDARITAEMDAEESEAP